jgi:hypothetical protein
MKGTELPPNDEVIAASRGLLSHTGSIYQRFLYKEKDDRWYPLEFLRNAALAEKEQEIAYQLWQDFIQRMAGNTQR